MLVQQTQGGNKPTSVSKFYLYYPMSYMHLHFAYPFPITQKYIKGNSTLRLYGKPSRDMVLFTLSIVSTSPNLELVHKKESHFFNIYHVPSTVISMEVIGMNQTRYLIS
jgi:hypothetical protein